MNAPKFIRPLFIAASGLVAAHAQTRVEAPVAETSANVATDFTMVQKSKSGCAFEPVKPTDSEQGLYRIIAFTKPKDYRGFAIAAGDMTITYKDKADFIVQNGIVKASPAIAGNDDVIDEYLKRHRMEIYSLARKAPEFLNRCRSELSI